MVLYIIDSEFESHPAYQILQENIVIQHMKKDLTTLTSGMIVHGCNLQGGFGSGVAGAIRKKWPEVAESYFKTYKDKILGDI